MEIFETGPGKLAILEGAGLAEPTASAIRGFGNGRSTRCLITDIAVELGERFQVAYSLEEVIFVHRFGARAGRLRASGVTLPRDCAETGDEAAAKGGLPAALDFYAANNISVATGLTTIVMAGNLGGSATFRGLLTQFTGAINRPEDRIGQFAFEFLTIPGSRRAV